MGVSSKALTPTMLITFSPEGSYHLHDEEKEMFSHRTSTKVQNEMKSPPRKRESRVNPGANESSSEVDQVLLDCEASATGSLVLIDEAAAATVKSSGRDEFPDAPIPTPLKT